MTRVISSPGISSTVGIVGNSWVVAAMTILEEEDHAAAAVMAVVGIWIKV